jgi:hypothetical protein
MLSYGVAVVAGENTKMGVLAVAVVHIIDKEFIPLNSEQRQL